MLLDKEIIREKLKAIAGQAIEVPFGMVPPPGGAAALKAELVGQALLVLDGHGKERLSQALKVTAWDGLAELRLACLAAMAVHGDEDCRRV